MGHTKQSKAVVELIHGEKLVIKTRKRFIQNDSHYENQSELKGRWRTVEEMERRKEEEQGTIECKNRHFMNKEWNSETIQTVQG